MRLDRNDGAALQVAPVRGSDPKPLNEPCRQVSPSRARDEMRAGRIVSRKKREPITNQQHSLVITELAS